ncbi:MAG: hypothetical protein A2Y98_02105 [Candidatus Portnoybacteria bacterium RBG_19FT_COMBO_36_7]|uniref:4-vinyl reductase 4VR domain-containing protein n=1 Tax=Candidatus Portnoybacteria bacterium RBG_19FT_COMBO_36_7 TaxID=1801992 RepID=A0A1G2F727_9BACT|nr:MAG: hypothetical protein A2Y98_02105 [Candidatus Portnoybacteria bacterium RBG_19FT_COMBO_36_7]
MSSSEIISQSEIDELISKPGKVKGAVFNTTEDYIRLRYGNKGIKLLENEMANLGHPLNFEKINNLDWYPIGLRVLSFIALKKAFSWGDKELIDMGIASPKVSFLIKLILRYFISIETTFKEAPRYWKNHYTPETGRLETIEFNKKEKFVKLRIYDFKVHPLFCVFYLGYFKGIAQFGGVNIAIQETKCMFKGDPYHEFIGRWV